MADDRPAHGSPESAFPVEQPGTGPGREPLGLPLLLTLRELPCLCVGGGTVASRRVPALLAAGAMVTIVSPSLAPGLVALARDGMVRYHARDYQPGDCLEASLVLAATDDPIVNQSAAAEGLALRALVCVAHDASLGNCSFMAASRRGPLLVAIHSGGASPVVARAIRQRVDEALPEGLEAGLEVLAGLRAQLKAGLDDPRERARRWQAVAASGWLERALFEPTFEAQTAVATLLGLPA